MKTRSYRVVTVAAFLVIFILSGPKAWAQGPPYQTDDPVPVDLHHYEFYIFGGVDGTPAEMDSTGPGLRVQLGRDSPGATSRHFALGRVAPSNNPVYLPGGTGPSAFGLTDMELGAKIAYHQGDQAHSADRHLHHVRDADRQVIPKDWAWERSGTSFPCGCRKTSANGCLTAARATRWFRRPATAIFLTADSC